MIAVSGGFDHLHNGHIDLLEAASKYGHVTVILNTDNWLIRKKGYVFMPWDKRARILSSLRFVQDISTVDDDDGTVCEALIRLRPEFFANGGDRITADPKEHDVCIEYGIKELFGIGGGKVNSSSEIIKAVIRNDHNKNAL